MSTQPLNWYKWHPKDFMTSNKVLALTWEERGIYRWLLDCQWVEGGIPADLSRCLRMLGNGAKKKALEHVVSTFFVPHPTLPGLLVNNRLHGITSETEDIREKRRHAVAERERRRTATPSHDTPAPHHVMATCSDTHGRERGRERREEKSREENTPLPPEGEKGECAGDTEEAFFRRFALGESKGLRPEFLAAPEFVAAWVEWVRHLKAKNRGFNPAFTTLNSHKQTLNAHSLDAAIFAMREAIERQMSKPADPSFRPAPPAADADPAAANADSARAALAESSPAAPHVPVLPPQRRPRAEPPTVPFPSTDTTTAAA